MSAPRDPTDGQFEMFGDPAGAAICPNPLTLLDYLAHGERVAQPELIGVSWGLTAYAGELRKLGWPVQSEPISYRSAKRPIARYLSSQDIAAARAAQGGAA